MKTMRFECSSGFSAPTELAVGSLWSGKWSDCQDLHPCGETCGFESNNIRVEVSLKPGLRKKAPLLFVAMCLLATFQVSATENLRSRTFVGYAFDLENRELVYREIHQETLDQDGQCELSTHYVGPQGHRIAVREVDFSDDHLAPRFRLDDFRAGYSEGLRRDGKKIVVFRQHSEQAELEEREMQRPLLLVADAGFDRLVTTYWDQLLAGDKVQADFVVPSRLRTLRFNVVKESHSTLSGEPVLTFRMTAANPFLRLLIGSIRVTYHHQGRFLMRYEGLSNVKALDGNMLTVRIDFPLSERGDWSPHASLKGAGYD